MGGSESRTLRKGYPQPTRPAATFWRSTIKHAVLRKLDRSQRTSSSGFVAGMNRNGRDGPNSFPTPLLSSKSYLARHPKRNRSRTRSLICEACWQRCMGGAEQMRSIMAMRL